MEIDQKNNTVCKNTISHFHLSFLVLKRANRLPFARGYELYTRHRTIAT